VLIDWFTVCAQIVNFLVLVALLKHFLYGPILRAMDAREQTIADRLAEAEQRRHAAAGRPSGRFSEKTGRSPKKPPACSPWQSRTRMSRRAELIEHARLEVITLKTGWQDAVKREQEAFVRHLRQMAGQPDLCHIAPRSLPIFAARTWRPAPSMCFSPGFVSWPRRPAEICRGGSGHGMRC
jgi:F-type H+-transporting ATPase subunit b